MCRESGSSQTKQEVRLSVASHKNKVNGGTEILDVEKPRGAMNINDLQGVWSHDVVIQSQIKGGGGDTLDHGIFTVSKKTGQTGRAWHARTTTSKNTDNGPKR